MVLMQELTTCSLFFFFQSVVQWSLAVCKLIKHYTFNFKCHLPILLASARNNRKGNEVLGKYKSVPIIILHTSTIISFSFLNLEPIPVLSRFPNMVSVPGFYLLLLLWAPSLSVVCFHLNLPELNRGLLL